MLVVSCNNGGGGEGEITPLPAQPAPATETEAILRLLGEYRGALIQEDIDRVQGLLSTDNVIASNSGFAQQRPMCQAQAEALEQVETFRDDLTDALNARTIIGVRLPEEAVQISADRRDLSFLEVESVLRFEFENTQDLTTLVQQTRTFRTTFQLIQIRKGESFRFRSTGVKRTGPQYQVTTRGQLPTKVAARVEITETAGRIYRTSLKFTPFRVLDNNHTRRCMSIK